MFTKREVMKTLNHKVVLYVVLFLSIVSVLGQLVLNNYKYVATFVVAGLATSFYTKNMSIILLVPLVVTNLLVSGNYLKEGFKSKSKKGKKHSKNKKKKPHHLKHDHESESEDEHGHESEDEHSHEHGHESEHEHEHEHKRKHKVPKGHKEKFGVKNKLVHRGKPAYIDPKDDRDEAVGENIDYAATLEQAYENLQDMLGDGGMDSLTKETKKLVGQQKSLMNSLKQMSPLLSEAKNTLDDFNLPEMGDIKKMMKSFNKKQ